jgi:uncharacterized protein YndB with AHSA1/START domain
MDGVDAVERDLILPASPDEVWEELTDPERLGEWFGAEVDGDVQTGESVRFTWPDGSQRRAVFERVEEPRRLVFRWVPSDDDPASRVEIEIDEDADGSAVRVIERQIEAAVSTRPRIGFRVPQRL